MRRACAEMNYCLSSLNKTASRKVVRVVASEMTTLVACKSTLEMIAT